MLLVKVSRISISATKHLIYLVFLKLSKTADIVRDFCKIVTPVACILRNLDTEILKYWTSHSLW